MGFLGKLGGALKTGAMAPFKATGTLAKGALGATKSAVTGHPMRAAKQLGRAGKTSFKTLSRPISRR